MKECCHWRSGLNLQNPSAFVIKHKTPPERAWKPPCNKRLKCFFLRSLLFKKKEKKNVMIS